MLTLSSPAVTGYPVSGGGSGSFKPAAGSSLPTMPVKYGAAAGGAGAMAGAGGMASAFGAGSKYKRAGSSILPFAMGAFAG